MANAKTEKIDRNAVRLSAVAGPVRVTLPADVAFNLDRLNTSLKNLAERLGHVNCLSGAPCLFTLERDFAVNPADLKVLPVGF